MQCKKDLNITKKQVLNQYKVQSLHNSPDGPQCKQTNKQVNKQTRSVTKMNTSYDPVVNVITPSR